MKQRGNAPTMKDVAREVCLALDQRGYRTILSVTSYDPEAEKKCVKMVQQNKVDGIVSLTYTPYLEVDPHLPVSYAAGGTTRDR